MPVDFQTTLRRHGRTLRRTAPRVLQLNVGKLCNLTCSHCHVNAGPGRKEIMTRATIDLVLAWQESARMPVVDITGGAPEMIPDFRYLVQRLREIDPAATIIDRCNLTILLDVAHESLAEFMAARRVQIIASMPCYTPENVNAQRGDGVFDASIRALQRLNAIGYGIDPALELHLVYNPLGDKLPCPQVELEADYKAELGTHFGIRFNKLYTITNLPIARFASWLRREKRFESYLELLANAFNPATIDGLMCRDTINVSWQGEVFDCDFNQMVGLSLGGRAEKKFLWDIDPQTLDGATIATAAHCFGCTAGAGSSCGGAIEVAAAPAGV